MARYGQTDSAETAAGTAGFINLGGDRLDFHRAPRLEPGQGVADRRHPFQHRRPDIHRLLTGTGQIDPLDGTLGCIRPPVQLTERTRMSRG